MYNCMICLLLCYDVTLIHTLCVKLSSDQAIIRGYMSRVTRKPIFGVSDGSDTNKSVQQQKVAINFGFRK